MAEMEDSHVIAALVLYILVASAVFVWSLTPRRSSVKLLLELEGDAEPFQAQMEKPCCNPIVHLRQAHDFSCRI